MKKALQRVVAVIFALALLIGFGSTTWVAADPLPPEQGSLTIHKYDLGDSGEFGPPGDGTELAQEPQDALPLAGIEFTVWPVEAPPNVVVESAEQARQYIDAAAAVTVVTGSDGTAKTQLKRGLYYVEETGSVGTPQQPGGEPGAAQTYFPCAPFLVSMPMRDPSGEDWISDIHVYPKNQAISIDKFVNEANGADYDFEKVNVAKYKPVSVGVPFGWTVVASLPRGLGSQAASEEYVVMDALPDHFSYTKGTLLVYSAPAANTPCAKAYKLQANVDYIEKFEGATNTVTISLTTAGIERLGQRYTDAAVNDRVLIIKYDCVLTEAAPCGVELPTGATLTYTRVKAGAKPASDARNADSGASATASVLWEPAVHTGQIKIKKVDWQPPYQPLAGATFGIAASEADAKARNFIAKATTGRDGTLVFTGLGYGAAGDRCNENSNNTRYWIVETKAPDGYHRVIEVLPIIFNHHQGADGEYYFAQLDVHNLPYDYSLLSTGDNNRIFIMFGLLLLSAAGIVTVVRIKKKKGQKA